MGFFDFLFKKDVVLQDAFFGAMLFHENRREPANNYFECARDFAPIGKQIELGVQGDVEGPSKAQKDFFNRIEAQYASLTLKFAPILEDVFRNWQPDFQIVDFKSEFEPVYLDLPRCTSHPVVWRIVFESSHDGNHHFSVTVHDFEPQPDVHIDG